MNPSRIYQPGNPMTEEHQTPTEDDELEPFPLDCLPPAAAGMARAIARTERTPETLAGCCVLGILSASIGAGIEVKSGPNRTTRGNLYLMPSAESGSGKSETFRHAAKPFFDFEHDLLERWKADDLPDYEADADLLKCEIANLTKLTGKNKTGLQREELRGELQTKKRALATLEAKLNPPRISCEDVTSEKLADLLAQNQEQLASLSPDGGSIVNLLLGRYNKLDRTDEGLYLKAFSGDNCRVDRKSGGSTSLQRPCLTAFWLVQPDKIATLLGERSLTDGGMVPRLLLCDTKAEPRYITDGLADMPDATVFAWAELVKALLKTYRFASAPITIEPAPDAYEVMKSHFNAIVDRWRVELRDVGPFVVRWNEQAWRIAVCLHAGLHGNEAGRHGLSLDTAQRAIRLAGWFAAEQLRILEGGRQAAKQVKREEVLKLLADKPSGITARDLLRARVVPCADEARALLAGMEDELTVRDSKPEGGGRPTRIYTHARIFRPISL